MNFQIRKASRGQAKPLIGLYAESGCGKTWSSLLLARGFAPKGRIIMIETEGGRGEAYVDMIDGGYEVVSIRGDFAPKNFGAALDVIETSGADVLIVDSASAEWEGAGGVLAMAAANQAAGKKGPIVWQQPKMDHQRHFMLRLMQTPIPLVIVCMRAKYPMIERLKPGTNQKEWMRSEVLEPKQADDILFEMFVHGWIDREHKLHVTKYTRPDLAQVIRNGEPITIETGRALAAWSRGDNRQPPQGHSAAPAPSALTHPEAEGATMSVEDMGREAAQRGRNMFDTFYASQNAAGKAKLRAIKAELEGLMPKEGAT